MLMNLRNFKKAKGFTLVELMIVVAIIGILAAIAIPAFLRYIKQSKTSEAEAIMKKMAEGSKAYFTSEQKYSPATGGAEPWHESTATTGATVPGLPVPFSVYSFPGGPGVGGTAVGINTAAADCASTAAIGAPAGGDTTAPQGGSKQIPCVDGVTTNADVLATLNKLRVEVKDPLYFRYNYFPAGVNTGATAEITALADFKTGGETHTIQQIVSVDAQQEVVTGPAVIYYEFE